MGGDFKVDVVQNGPPPVPGIDALQREHRLDGLGRAVSRNLTTPDGGLRSDLLRPDAADVVDVGDRPQRGHLLAALRDGEGTAGLEGAARGATPGRWRVTRDPDQLTPTGQMWDGDDQTLRVRMTRGLEHLRGWPELDDPSGIHHRHTGGECPDDSEVMAHVERRDAMRRGQVADGVEDVGLCRHVEAGGRLVEHDDPRAAGERDGEPDTLLLAARKLVGIVAQEARRVGQSDLAHHFADPRATVVRVLAKAVRFEHLAQLGADPQRRVERGGRVLRNIADHAAAQALPICRIALQDLDIGAAEGAMPSPTRPVPTVNSAMAATGSTTPQGCTVSAM